MHSVLKIKHICDSIYVDHSWRLYPEHHRRPGGGLSAFSAFITGSVDIFQIRATRGGTTGASMPLNAPLVFRSDTAQNDAADSQDSKDSESGAPPPIRSRLAIEDR